MKEESLLSITLSTLLFLMLYFVYKEIYQAITYCEFMKSTLLPHLGALIMMITGLVLLRFKQKDK